MLSESVIARDGEAGRIARWFYDDVTGECHVLTESAVGDVLELNATERNNWCAVESHGDMVRIGRIPLAKMFALQRAGIISDDDPFQKKFLRWLKDPDNAAWRTVPKSVI